MVISGTLKEMPLAYVGGSGALRSVAGRGGRLQVCSRTIYRWLRAYGMELTELRPEAARQAGVG